MNPDDYEASEFSPFYLHFIPQVVNFNNKGTNHGPHDPKKEQNKGPQNDQKCDFGHHVSPSSRTQLKRVNRYRNRFSEDINNLLQ